jgi:hypothetical protein
MSSTRKPTEHRGLYSLLEAAAAEAAMAAQAVMAMEVVTPEAATTVAGVTAATDAAALVSGLVAVAAAVAITKEATGAGLTASAPGVLTTTATKVCPTVVDVP